MSVSMNVSHKCIKYKLGKSNQIYHYNFNLYNFTFYSFQAVSAASVFSDRLCIATGGAVAKNLSSEHVNSCCYRCGHGCDGGFPEGAWYFFRRHGIVTGGDYNSGEVIPINNIIIRRIRLDHSRKRIRNFNKKKKLQLLR